MVVNPCWVQSPKFRASALVCYHRNRLFVKVKTDTRFYAEATKYFDKLTTHHMPQTPTTKNHNPMSRLQPQNLYHQTSIDADEI